MARTKTKKTTSAAAAAQEAAAAASPVAEAAAAAPGAAAAAAAATPPADAAVEPAAAAAGAAGASKAARPSKRQPKKAAGAAAPIKSKKAKAPLSAVITNTMTEEEIKAKIASITTKTVRRGAIKRSWTAAEFAKAYDKFPIFTPPEHPDFHKPVPLGDNLMRLCNMKGYKQRPSRLSKSKGYRVNWLNLMGSTGGLSMRVSVNKEEHGEWMDKLITWDDFCRAHVIENNMELFFGHDVVPQEADLKRDFEPVADGEKRPPNPVYNRVAHKWWEHTFADGRTQLFSRIDLAFNVFGKDVFYKTDSGFSLVNKDDNFTVLAEAVSNGNFIDFVILPKGVHTTKRTNGMPTAKPNIEVLAVVIYETAKPAAEAEAAEGSDDIVLVEA